MAIRSAARACSICSPAPARSASKRCRAARPSRYSSTTARRRARSSAKMSPRSALAASSRIFRRDATKLGPAHPLEPFSLAFLDPPYGQNLAADGARLGARRRLARARRAGRRRGSGKIRASPRRKDLPNWSGALTTIPSSCSAGGLEHDPEKLALGLDPGVDTGFRKRSCSNKKLGFGFDGIKTGP